MAPMQNCTVFDCGSYNKLLHYPVLHCLHHSTDSPFLKSYNLLNCRLRYSTIVYCTIMYFIELYYIVMYCTALYRIVFHVCVLPCTALYCTLLRCTVMYSNTLYCTALYCTVVQCIPDLGSGDTCYNEGGEKPDT